MKRAKLIRTYADLLEFFQAYDFKSLNRRVYKDTECGASVSIYGKYKGKPAEIHNGMREIVIKVYPSPLKYVPLKPDGSFPAGFTPTAFTIQTIVEGSEATVDSDLFPFGVYTTEQVEHWIADMEAEAERLWKVANE